MTTHRSPIVPTAAQLAALGVAVADEGPEAHHRELVRLAFVAGELVGPTAAAEVLADPDSPSIVRQRALAVVSAAVLRAEATPQRRESRTHRVPTTRSTAARTSARPTEGRAALTFALASRQLVR